MMKMKRMNQINRLQCLSKLVCVSVTVLVLGQTMPALAETKLAYRMSPSKPTTQKPGIQNPKLQSNAGSTFLNSTYKDVTVAPEMTRPNIYQQHYPYPPQQDYPYHTYPRPNQHLPYPQGNGITIIYNQSLPSQTTYTHQSYGYVNGTNGSIQSSSYMLISDWRRYGLPDPAVGMHWIYQSGRYLQVPNDY